MDTDRELLLDEIERLKIPPIFAQDDDDDPILYLELSLAGFHRRWFVAEAERYLGDDLMFFGFVNGDKSEWSGFWLSDFQATNRRLLINPDFQPMLFSKLKKQRDL